MKNTYSNDERDMLVRKINNEFYNNKMPYMLFRFIDKCLYEYDLDEDMIYSLFIEAKKGRILYSVPKIESIVLDWIKNEATDSIGFDAYTNKKATYETIVKLMGKLSRRRLNGIDLERIECWVNELDVTPELAELAFRKNEFRGIILMKHVEDRIREWREAGVVTLEDAKNYEYTRWIINKEKYLRRHHYEVD